jgi:hypothetical protein
MMMTMMIDSEYNMAIPWQTRQGGAFRTISINSLLCAMSPRPRELPRRLSKPESTEKVRAVFSLASSSSGCLGGCEHVKSCAAPGIQD